MKNKLDGKLLASTDVDTYHDVWNILFPVSASVVRVGYAKRLHQLNYCIVKDDAVAE